MQGVKRQDQPAPLLRGQPILHQSQIQIFIASIKFVSNDWMPKVRQVDANLVLSPRIGTHPQEGGGAVAGRGMGVNHRLRARRCGRDNPIIRARWHTIGADTVLDGHPTLLVFAQGGGDRALRFLDAAVDERQVVFFDQSLFPNPAQLTGRALALGNQHHSAGLSIQAIHHLRPRRRTQVKRVRLIKLEYSSPLVG